MQIYIREYFPQLRSSFSLSYHQYFITTPILFTQKWEIFSVHVNSALIAQPISRVRSEINSIISFSYLGIFYLFFTFPTCLFAQHTSHILFWFIQFARKEFFSRKKKLFSHIQFNFIYLKNFPLRKAQRIDEVKYFTLQLRGWRNLHC